MGVVATAEALSLDSRVMQTITRHMDSLKDSLDGDDLYAVIARVLRKHERRGTTASAACLMELHGQLEAYANDPITLPSMRIRARLLQQHIGPYLPEPESAASAPAASAARTDSVDVEYLDAAPPPDACAGDASAQTEAVLEGALERPTEPASSGAAAQGDKYQSLLRSEKDAWQAIYGTVKDYHKLKQAWMQSLDELAQQRDAL